MNYLFYNFNIFKTLPKKSNWNTFNATKINHMLFLCEGLISIITNMKVLFCCCRELKSTPGISKRNNSNVTHISNIFDSCK